MQRMEREKKTMSKFVFDGIAVLELLAQITVASGNHRATSRFQRKLDESDWAIYRIRRSITRPRTRAECSIPRRKGPLSGRSRS